MKWTATPCKWSREINYDQVPFFEYYDIIDVFLFYFCTIFVSNGHGIAIILYLSTHAPIEFGTRHKMDTTIAILFSNDV
jgi:hypothetical protein